MHGRMHCRIIGRMPDTTVRLDMETRDRLRALANDRGQSLPVYLEELSRQEENRARLSRATAAFERVISDPGYLEAFDDAFGGLPATRQAA